MKFKTNSVLAGAGAAAVLLLPALALAQAAATPAPAAAPKFDTGDTAWMLTATALVLMMTIPGLALFYGGMVRKKNVLATVMQSFAITCMISVLWLIVGYSLAFTPGSSIIGGLSRIFMAGLTLGLMSMDELELNVRCVAARVCALGASCACCACV